MIIAGARLGRTAWDKLQYKVGLSSRSGCAFTSKMERAG
jgi:hypothetical protein